MTATTTTQTPAKSPCGCGSGTTAPTSGCGCGGGCGCSTCQGQVYERPQFFAGQLLTEDDLESLIDYVVAKNRLHNRYLFGDGVVCGLTVTCAPCESGHVTVNPGYALDCCGNDIVVSCPQDLDINQMVRQLMLKLRQADCGDPCAGSSSQKTGAANSPVNATSAAPNKPGHGRRYCLYVDYCEQQSDPVAPYASNSTCGQAVCEPTRIVENFRFELRCPVEHECASGVNDRFWNSVGDARSAQKTVVQYEFLRRYAPSLKEALDRIREHPPAALDSYFWNELEEHRRALSPVLETFGKQKVKEIDEARIRPVLDRVLDLASKLARIWVHSDPRLSIEHPGLIEGVENELRNACDGVRPELVEQAFQSSLPRLRGLALLQLTRELLVESGAARGRLASGSAQASHISRNVSFQLLAERVIYNRLLAFGISDALASMRDWIVNRLEQQQSVTRCALLCDVNAVMLQTPGLSFEINDSSARTIVSASATLVAAVPEVLRGCLCEAMIPACPPCEDPGVLLACLTVEDCKVTEICNLDRKFVITGPNIRYWVPEICRLGEALEKWCCPSCHREDQDTLMETETEHRSYEDTIYAALGRAPAYTKLAMSATLEPRGPSSQRLEPVRRTPLEFLAPLMSSWRDAEGMRVLSVLQPAENTAELQRELASAMAEIKTLKRDQNRLRERMAKIEKKKGGEDTSD